MLALVLQDLGVINSQPCLVFSRLTARKHQTAGRAERSLDFGTVFAFNRHNECEGQQMFDEPANDRGYFNAMVMNKRIADQNARDAWAWKAKADALEAELAQTKMLLENAEMSEAGFKAGYNALRDALKAVAPSHPLVSNTGIRYANGEIKSGVRIVWEKAFDAKGVELRISNPKSRRND
jgi:hypothetical protein